MRALGRVVLVSLMAAASSTWAGQADRSASAAAGTQSVSLITGRIDNSKLVTLAGNTRPEANAKNDRGRVADTLPLDHMILQLRRSAAQERALDEYIDQLHDPGSPNFHKWLTAKQLGEKFGLAQSDIGKITSWLKSYGFRINGVPPSRMTIDFSGTAGEVRRAFHTEIHKLQVDGVDHIANMSDPRIPAALAPAVAGVVSLHDFKPRPLYEARTNYTFSGGCGLATACYILAPADLATIYNLNPLFTKGYSGQGQTIVVVEDTDVYSTTDWSTFRSTFGLSASYPMGSFAQIHPNAAGNSCTDPGVTSNDGEATLDAEWASAAAPSAAIELASCADTTTFGGFIALQNLLNAGSPPAIVSVSYGDSETDDGAGFNNAINTLYQQAVTEGVSVFVSSGDQLAAVTDRCNAPCEATHGINVNGWASTVYNVAVGGTDFGDTYAGTNSTYWSSTNGSDYGSALSYVPEIPWNDSCASQLIARFLGYTLTYGSSGFCNSSLGANFLDVAGGSGGPSACATGTPTTPGVVSGTCAGYPKPSWQSVFGNPSDGVRDLPDLSLFAANGFWGHSYVFCFSDPHGGSPCTGAPSGWSFAGGTSFAAPIMAAIQSLVNQSTGQSWGNPNPTYYALAAAEYGAIGDPTCNSSNGNTVGSNCIFYDVTEGDIDAPCTGSYNCYLPSGTYGVLSESDSVPQIAFATVIGWDFATGIGTINAYNLVTGWSSASKTTTTTNLALKPSATVNVGTSITLSATVGSASSGNPPNGETVTFTDTISNKTLGTGKLTQGAATFTSSTIVGGTYSVVAKYPGDATFAASQSAAQTLNVQDFTISAKPTSVMVTSPGQASQTTLTIKSEGNFNQNLSYSCTGLPAETTCTFTAASATTETLAIQTTAASWRFDPAPFGPNRQFYYALFLPGFFGLISTAGASKKNRWRIALLILALVLIVYMPACGGGGSSGNPGTPTGTSQVTVTAATSGTSPISHQVPITLTVQ